MKQRKLTKPKDSCLKINKINNNIDDDSNNNPEEQKNY